MEVSQLCRMHNASQKWVLSLVTEAGLRLLAFLCVATCTHIRGLREGMCVTSSSCTLGHQKLPPCGLHVLLPSCKLPKMLRGTATCKLTVAEPREPGFQMIAWSGGIPTDPSSQCTVTAEGNFREPWIWASTCCRGLVHPCQNTVFPIFRDL